MKHHAKVGKKMVSKYIYIQYIYKRLKNVVFIKIMASCYSLPLSASALLLLNFHVFVYTLRLHIVCFISLEHLAVITRTVDAQFLTK